MLVIEGLVGAGEPWFLRLSSSQPFDGQGTELPDVPTAIDSATVEIWEGSAFVAQLMPLGEGRYGSEFPLPESNRTYTVRASMAGFADVEAEATPRGSPDISASWDAEPGAELRLQLAFQDDPAVENGYSLRIRGGSQEPYDPSQLLLAFGVPFETTASAIRAESFFDAVQASGGQRLYYSALFSDASFSGERFDAVLNLQIAPDVEGPFVVELVTTDKAGTALLQAARREDDSNPFVEGRPAFSNVRGGLGTWGAYSTAEVALGPTPQHQSGPGATPALYRPRFTGGRVM